MNDTDLAIADLISTTLIVVCFISIFVFVLGPIIIIVGKEMWYMCLYYLNNIIAMWGIALNWQGLHGS
jgi:hypothetical protein